MQRFETIPGLTHSDSEPQERHLRQATSPSSFCSGFRIGDVPGQGRTLPPSKIHALDRDEHEAAIAVKPEAFSHGKGLGETNSEPLREATMSPDTRRLMRIRMPGAEAVRPVMNMLMAKGESADRRAWMEENGALIGAEI